MRRCCRVLCLGVPACGVLLVLCMVAPHCAGHMLRDGHLHFEVLGSLLSVSFCLAAQWQALIVQTSYCLARRLCFSLSMLVCCATLQMRTTFLHRFSENAVDGFLTRFGCRGSLRVFCPTRFGWPNALQRWYTFFMLGCLLSPVPPAPAFRLLSHKLSCAAAVLMTLALDAKGRCLSFGSADGLIH